MCNFFHLFHPFFYLFLIPPTGSEMNRYSVVKIEPCGGYILRVTFADGRCNVIDFEPYLIKRPHPQYNQYYDPIRFLDYKIEYGNLVWGDNWDLMFDSLNLYYNNLFKNYD